MGRCYSPQRKHEIRQEEDTGTETSIEIIVADRPQLKSRWWRGIMVRQRRHTSVRDTFESHHFALCVRGAGREGERRVVE